MNRPSISSCVAPLLGVVLLSLSGCVSEIVKPEREIVIMATRVGDEYKVSWQSKQGEQYVVWYSETLGKGSQWKILPGCEHVVGTGEFIEKTDHVPVGLQHYYHIEKARSKK